MLLIEAARAVGINTGYHDIWGGWREVPESTLVAALQALGHAGAPDAAALACDVERGLQTRAAHWLPPLLMAAAGDPVRIRLDRRAAPAADTAANLHAATALHWTLELEDGETLAGTLDVAAAADAVAGIELPVLPVGRHRLQLGFEGAAGRAADAIVLVAPARCHLPDALAAGARQWGLAVQLYGVRSARNWGIGDFTDMFALVDACAALGGRVIGLNPLHALSLDRPDSASPYSAVSRLFLHPIYIDPLQAHGFSRPETAHELCNALAPAHALAALRAAERVAYHGVCAVKLTVLRALYEAFVRDESDTPAGAEFRAFRQADPALLSHATFQSIQLALHAADASVWGWPCWPEALRDPASPAVAQWQREHAHDIGFHVYLEWQARLQWAQVLAHARAAGVALYGDLALGADRGGSEVWAAQREHALSMSVGCPPDDFNLQGQDWGLPPLRPDRLQDTGGSAFQAVVRAGMAQFDALRLDHVMSLMRLFWIPPGQTPAAGAYVEYPFDALLAVLKIESVRNRCMVIGEDLGTVPPRVREELQAADVLSYRLLVFERDSATHFRHPGEYPRLALASLGSHDLSPIQGWWSGDDLAVRARIGLLDAGQFERFSQDRCDARRGLLATLDEVGLLPPGASTDPAQYPQLPDALVDAVHEFLGRSEAMWALVNVEDAFGLVEATNVPGTTHQHPNWSRKLPVTLEDWASHAGLCSIARRMQAVRSG